MAWQWPAELIRGVLGAAAPVAAGTRYYIGLAVMLVIMVGVLVYAYRTWEEINDVEEPDSPADLLQSFEQAHAEGEIDAHELERVRRLLADNPERTAPEGEKGGMRSAVNVGEGEANPEA